MAKIWFVNRGKNPTEVYPNPVYEISLNECIDLFGGDKIEYLGEKNPKFEGKSKLDYYKAEFVIVELDKDDVLNFAPNQKLGFHRPCQEGFYHVSISPEKVKKILKDR